MRERRMANEADEILAQRALVGATRMCQRAHRNSLTQVAPHIRDRTLDVPRNWVDASLR
jgi:hypothetical protein